ncbi:4-(cytidine 5'-diphospho)-2-C-methyl-D-erythritol kinase [Roseovarius sp. SYSU LYC5161]|uniref:4-(cytidine 5'-diphospho)-2-C-methyl-D-erythritol kinase n=1 Tax=Roseovarius halophilus (ex Wu et al. 2025) TaxID=3376060 RepID=UPI00399A7E34
MAEVFAPAKINLTLHVTGRREDGYHELDSLVMFADIGDRITVTRDAAPRLVVTGPMAGGVPTDDRNLVRRAADLIGVPADMTLEKNLPHAAGLGGGSSDAAAALKALTRLGNRDLPDNLLALGADVPVCLAGTAARVRGVGEAVTPIAELPVLHAVLVNPKLPVLTAEVFRRLARSCNPPMPDALPAFPRAGDMIDWLRGMRNDLEKPAIEAEPVIEQVFATLKKTPGCQLTRMSGSGGTCFGLYGDAETAAAAAGRLRESYPGWWVTATRLNAA